MLCCSGAAPAAWPEQYLTTPTRAEKSGAGEDEKINIMWPKLLSMQTLNLALSVNLLLLACGSSLLHTNIKDNLE